MPPPLPATPAQNNTLPCRQHRLHVMEPRTYHELGALCLLLSHLLSLNCCLVDLAERELSDGDIIQDDVKEARTLRQDPQDVLADNLAHRQQLACIVLCNYALQCLL